MLRAQGNLTAAQALAEQILASGREIGDQRVVANVLAQLGIIQSQRGDVAGSIVRLREALDVYRKLGDNNAFARALNNLAGIAAVERAVGRSGDDVRREPDALPWVRRPQRLSGSR